MKFWGLPPAEAKLPLVPLIKSYFGGEDDFAVALSQRLGVENCLVAESARGLLYSLFCYLSQRAGTERNEVLLPGYTCYSVAAAAVKAGLKVALYDLDPSTLQADVESVRNNITSRTLAVVGQYLLRRTPDFNDLSREVRSHGIPVILDSSQSLDWAGVRVDTVQADFILYSFGRGKPLPLGSGGALVATESGVLNEIFPQENEMAQKRGCFLYPLMVQMFCNPRLYWILERLPLGLGQTRFDTGFQVKAMPTLYQRIGVAGLSFIEKLNIHRITISKVYKKFFTEYHSHGMYSCDNDAFIRYPVFITNISNIDKVHKYGARMFYPSALCDVDQLKPYLSKMMCMTIGSVEISKKIITLPTHLAVDTDCAQEIAKNIINI